MSSQTEDTSTQMSDEEIATKILHILDIYPIISPTMLQAGIGPYVKPRQWRPVLNTLIEEGKVVEVQDQRETPAGRYNAYTKLHLPGVKVVSV